MDMRAASVLPLKPQPVVCGSKDSSVEDLGELNVSVIEEPVCEGWILDDCLCSGSPAVRVVGADEFSQLWPRDICCTVSEEDCRQTQCVNHGEQATPLTLSVLWCHADWRRSGVYTRLENVPPLVQGQVPISWVLSDVYSASLKAMASHIGVGGGVARNEIVDAWQNDRHRTAAGA